MGRFDRILETGRYDRIVELSKGNPYHDPKTGRFTSGPGGSAGVAFTPAGTMEEARAYARDKLGFSGTVDYGYSYIDQKAMRQVSGTLDMDTVNHVNKTITEIQDKYPELRGVVKNLSCTDRNVYAEVVHNGRDGTAILTIGAKRYKDGLAPVYEAWKDDVDLGYHPKGTTADAVLWHEYGHVYAGEANGAGRTARAKLQAIGKSEAEAAWKDEAARKLGVSPADYAQNVSRYATMNDGELFAEAFGAHNTGHGNKWTDALLEAAGAMRRK